MIYASGVVTFLSNDQKFRKKFKRKTLALEVIDEIPPNADSPGKTVCKYVALLPRSFECRSLEDYTGKIKPFLQKSIDNIIVTVQVSHLNYASERAVAKIKK